MAKNDKTARRILVALDWSPYGLAALETAAKFAAEMPAKLEGLFVEDINLLRLARLPFAQEVMYASAVPRQLDLASVESSLHAKADEIRRALENTCHRVSVQWSFEVSRGDVTRTTLHVSSEADLVIIGRQGLAQAAKVDLARKPRPKRPIVVAYDGTEAAKRALELASQLARTETRPITVVLANPGIEQADELRQACEEACQMAGINVLLDTQLVSDATALCHAVHRWKGEILLINRDSPMLDENTIEALVNRLDSPIGLVR